MTKHISIFKKEVLANLRVQQSGAYADLTLGGGGHAAAIWQQLSKGTLIVCDIDLQAINGFLTSIGMPHQKQTQANQEYIQGEKRLVAANVAFDRVAKILKESNIPTLQGAVADLGWSTDQLDTVPGLSYRGDSPLDMRMRADLQVTAADLLNGLYRGELELLFDKNADIRGRQQQLLIEKIIDFRKQQPFTSTSQLTEICEQVFILASQSGMRAQNFCARVFQALRIAVNNELSTLQSMLNSIWDTLDTGGTLQVITFHSGEYKELESFIKNRVAEMSAKQIYSTGYALPSVEEVRLNLSARSARLYAVVKL